MIDLGLTKIALIGAVALVVIGPERLPAVARMAGTLFGRAQRYISNVKAEVNREMQMDELRKMQDNIVSSANDLNKSVADDIAEAEQDFSKAIAEANQAFVGVNEGLRVPSEGEIAAKQRDFRKKKLTQNSSSVRQDVVRVSFQPLLASFVIVLAAVNLQGSLVKCLTIISQVSKTTSFPIWLN